MKNIYKQFPIIIFTLLLYYSSTYADNEKFVDLIFPTKDYIQPSDLPRLAETEFKKYRPEITQSLKDDEFCGNNLDQLTASDFYTADFNGDGANDIMFSSYCGSEELRNYIWFQERNTLRFISFIVGTPLRLYHNNKSGYASLVVSKGWCCAGYVGSLILYNLERDNKGNFIYKPSRKIMEFGGLSLPTNRIEPIRFIVTKNKERLRSSPEVYDTPDDSFSVLTRATFYGNIMAEFSKGSQGEAIAEQRDKAGKLWWFVIMDKNAKTSTNHFYDDEEGYKAGWMSARSLKRIK